MLLLIEYSVLSNTQKASSDYSFAWKSASRRLFDEAQSYKEFVDALKWCGRNGNVLRTVSTIDFNSFAADLYVSLETIRDGTFDLNNVPYYSGKKPISFVSKICHIINPRSYPIIYDSYVRKAAHLRDVDSFICLMNEYIKEFKNATDNEIYRVDSNIWASQN